MSFSIHRDQQLYRGCSSSSSFSNSPFVVQLDGQQWDLSNLVLTDEGEQPPPPPGLLSSSSRSITMDHQPNICSSSDDSSLMSEAMLAVISPSPLGRQRKQAAFQRQSSLTSFCAQTFYPKHDDVLQQNNHDPQQQPFHHFRRRSRRDMSSSSSSGMNQVVEDEEYAEMMCVDAQHDDDDDVFRSTQQLQVIPNRLTPQHRVATFDDCSSLSSNSTLFTSKAPTTSKPQSTKWIEVMPEQFLPLVGDSYATWQAIISNNAHQVTCDICQTQHYCMTTISTVFCSSCRSLFPNTHFTSGPGGLGLGMPMEDAHRELKLRNVKRPPPASSSSTSHRTIPSRAAAPAQQQTEESWTRRSCASSTDSANASFRNMVATPH